MSRDPENGIATDPATLHKYLYAGGDPVNRGDPTGRNTAVLPRPMGGSEYAMIVGQITLATVASLTALACAIDIQYAMDALKVQGYTDVIPWGFCSAKGRKKCTCEASCTCHVIGMPDHGNTGVFVYGSGTASSCPAARTEAKVDAGMSCAPGSHAQHCSYQCTQ
jgi:hypothetical protein